MHKVKELGLLCIPANHLRQMTSFTPFDLIPTHMWNLQIIGTIEPGNSTSEHS
jgi:hypothetical protein